MGTGAAVVQGPHHSSELPAKLELTEEGKAEWRATPVPSDADTFNINRSRFQIHTPGWGAEDWLLNDHLMIWPKMCMTFISTELGLKLLGLKTIF